MRNRLVGAAALVLITLGVGVGVAAWALDRAGVGEPPPDAAAFDAIVVLGCGVRPDGTASRSLTRRARLGARLLREGRAPRIVFTGGVGTHPPSEAQAARAAAECDGPLPDEAVILEERSTSTHENASEAARLLPTARRVLVVSDTYHLVRARRIFRHHFDEVETAGTAGTPGVRARYALREVFAFLIHLALDR